MLPSFHTIISAQQSHSPYHILSKTRHPMSTSVKAKNVSRFIKTTCLVTRLHYYISTSDVVLSSSITELHSRRLQSRHVLATMAAYKSHTQRRHQ